MLNAPRGHLISYQQHADPVARTEYLTGVDEVTAIYNPNWLSWMNAAVFGAMPDSIGAAIARALVALGVRSISIHEKEEHNVQATAELLRSMNRCPVFTYTGDMGIRGEGRRLAMKMEQDSPGLNGIMWVCGVSGYVHETEPDMDYVDTLIRINTTSALDVFGYFLGLHRTRRLTDDKARLDLLGMGSSQDHFTVGPKRAIYSLTKAGIVRIVRSLVVPNCANGVRGHLLSPGCTDVFRHFSDADFIATRNIAEATPLGEPFSAADIAQALCASLAMPKSHVPAFPWVIDGGWQATGGVPSEQE